MCVVTLHVYCLLPLYLPTHHRTHMYRNMNSMRAETFVSWLIELFYSLVGTQWTFNKWICLRFFLPLKDALFTDRFLVHSAPVSSLHPYLCFFLLSPSPLFLFAHGQVGSSVVSAFYLVESPTQTSWSCPRGCFHYPWVFFFYSFFFLYF